MPTNFCLRFFIKLLLIHFFIFTFGFSSSIFSNVPESVRLKMKRFSSSIIKQTKDSCFLLLSPEGEVLMEHNINKKMTPASITKILLMLTAFESLKEDFKFYTEYYIDSDRNLLIKGFGDPFVISEELTIVAKTLKGMGHGSFKSITLDDSYFSNVDEGFLTNTDNPYDAINGALVINFNTIYVGRDKAGKLYSPEPQTPLVSVAKELAINLPRNKEKRYNIGYSQKLNDRFRIEVISELFARESLYILGAASTVDRSDFKLIYRHQNTKDLDEIATGLMKYSNNFIANQIFLVMGALNSKAPANFNKGRTNFTRLLDDIFPGMQEEYYFEEGSGLSRKNYVTCQFMGEALKEYKKYYDTMPTKSRSHVKTGSLNGVNNIVGYIRKQNRLYPVVLILYTHRNLRDKFLGIMENLVDAYEEAIY